MPKGSSGIGARKRNGAVEAGQFLFQTGVVRRHRRLAAAGLGALDLLQHDDVGLVRFDLGNGGLEIDGGVVGIALVPDLAKLHVELENVETAHREVRSIRTVDAKALRSGAKTRAAFCRRAGVTIRA